MKYNLLYVLISLGMLSCVQTEDKRQQTSIPDKIDFNHHIKPILSDRCYTCHGPDENTREANLRLDLAEEAFGALSSEGQAVISKGNSGQSALIHRIMSDDESFTMPPPESELFLSNHEKQLIKKWIDQGAEWKGHWAFIPPEEPTLPKVRNKQWCQNEIDFFITRRIEDMGLKPTQYANREQWLRRVSFDITGLPPTKEDLNSFINDSSDDAFEKVVDRLLASPSYGERMASEWLDISRYADSHGYQDDRPRTSWPWRDWVVEAFNDNLSYKDFVTWQLAGDLLPNATYEQKLATGFNRNHAITQEGGVVQEEYLNEYAADRVNTFSTAFLGMTMECARCHSHKYDPISQKDYYSLLAFFNNIPERGQISYFDLAPEPNMRLENEVLEKTIQANLEAIEQLENEQLDWSGKESDEFLEWLSSIDNKPPEFLEDDGDLLAQYSFDHPDNPFNSDVQSAPEARLNVNLPPAIPRPNMVSGIQGNALEFNGSNFLSLGDVGDFDWYQPFTIGGWIKHSGTHDRDAGFFSRRNGEQKRQGYDMILTREGQVKMRLIHHYVNTSWSGEINYAIDIQSKRRISPNQWSHVCATYSGNGRASGLKIFINGEEQSIKINMDSLRRKSILNGNDFLVGNWNHRNRKLEDLHGFKGGIVDDVFIYGRELSQIEIRQLAGFANDPNRDAWHQYYLLNVDNRMQELTNRLVDLRAQDMTIPEVMIMKENEEAKPTFVLARGAYDAPTDSVIRNTPASILPFSGELESNRLGLAKWLFHDNHPLTSRVLVNRFWQRFFGKGLVTTPEDFGNQGARPTHPELLDWLAIDFKENGWDMKRLIKKITLSATYRQDAAMSPTQLDRDKDNLLLARGPNKRLTAEMLRDQFLFASGLLTNKIGGKWVKPYQPRGLWKEMANQIGENKYRPSRGDGLFRRSLYGYWKRTIPPPNMLTFDASERAVCTVKRQFTTTPLQSLLMLNDPQIIEACRYFASNLLNSFEDPEAAINEAFYTITSRKPKKEESEILTNLFHEKLDYFSSNLNSTEEFLSIGQAYSDLGIKEESHAAMTVVVNAIFNLDESKYN